MYLIGLCRIRVADATQPESTRAYAYALEFSEQTILLRKVPGLEPIYLTDNFAFTSNGPVYGFTVDDKNFYVTQQRLWIPELEELSYAGVYVLHDSGLDKDFLTRLFEVADSNYILRTYELQLSSKIIQSCLDEQLLESTIAYAPIQIDNILYIVYAQQESDSMKFTVSPELSTDWWISPFNTLCFKDRKESYQLDFTIISDN